MPLVTLDPAPPSGPADRDDIVHIKHRLGPTSTVAATSGVPAGFYAWNGVPLLAWLGTLVWRKRREARLRNPRLQRELEIHRALEDGFRRLEQYSEAGDSEAFFSTLFRMLQDRISLTLDQPGSGITEIVIEEKLAPMGLSDETQQALSGLFQACDAARYAPVEDRQELAAIIPRLRTALGGLEDIEE
jgi:hypothetical protein